MKQSVFKPEHYEPSSEDHRQSVETQRNYHRNNAYLDKRKKETKLNIRGLL